MSALLARIAGLLWPRNPIPLLPLPGSEGDPMTASPLATVRKRRFGLGSLPDVIRVPALPPLRPTAFEVRTEEATLDEIAFAADAAEAEFDRASERYHALRRLYRYARQSGACGADRAVEAAIMGAK